MSHLPVPSSAFNGGLNTSGALTPIPRPVGRALDAVRHQGMIRAAYLQAAGFVAHVGQQELALLSMDELIYSEHFPHASGRFAAIVDAYAVVAAHAVARLGA